MWVKGLLNDIVYSVRTGVMEYKGEKDYYSTGSIQNRTYKSEGSYSETGPGKKRQASMILFHLLRIYSNNHQGNGWNPATLPDDII